MKSTCIHKKDFLNATSISKSKLLTCKWTQSMSQSYVKLNSKNNCFKKVNNQYLVKWILTAKCKGLMGALLSKSFSMSVPEVSIN